MKFNKILIWIFSISILIMAVGFFVYFCSIQLPRRLDGRIPYDFPNYYFAGKRLWNGQSVYSGIADDVLKFFGYKYYKIYPADPPFAVLALSFYSFLPYPWAWGINIFFSLSLMILVVGLTCRLCNYKLSTFISLIGIAIVSNPFLNLIVINHYEVILALLGSLGWNAFRNGKTWPGGIFWGLAASLKLFPIFWFFALPQYLGWRAFLKSCFFFLIFSILGILVLGTENSIYYILKVIPDSRMWYGTVGNYSLISFGYAFNAPWVGWLLAFLFFLLGIYASFYKKSNFTAVWIELVILSLLISPISWLNYLVLTIPLILILMTTIKTNIEKLTLIILTILLLFAPADTVKTNYHGLTVILTSIPLLGLISLWIYTFIHRKARLV